MRLAILGAGIAGVCAALELARRGHAVELYDENPEPLVRASQNNEGKIHLGLVYAKDDSLKTARTMILGAVNFMACLKRWIDLDQHDAYVSSPYHYAVHRETMTDPDPPERHYDQCQRMLADACASTGLSYVDGERRLLVEKLSTRDMEALVDREYFLCVFRTSERAVDPRVVGDRLRAAVHADPRIRFIANARVFDAAWCDGTSLRVSFRVNGEEYSETYDQVVNTLWDGRLEIDAKLGLAPEREWLYRYKLGGSINAPVEPKAVPSLTIVLGPFGDLVNFGPRGLYVSWYPVGMIGTSRELTPPEWDRSLPAARRQALLRDSYEELRRRCPPLRSLDYSECVAEPAGGVIFAWGATDIHNGDSPLHTRYQIGIHSVRNYHSVNTGKYTMGPYLGYKTAERVLGIA